MPIITNDGYNDVNLDQRRSSSIVPADTYFHQPPPDQQKYKNAMQFAEAAERLGSSIQSATAQIGNSMRAADAEKEKNDLLKTDDVYAAVSADIANGGPQAAQANPMLAELSPAAQMRVNEKLGHDGAAQALVNVQNEYAEKNLWADPEGSAAFLSAKGKEAADYAASNPGYGGGYYKTFSAGLISMAHGAASARAGKMQSDQYEDFGQQTLQQTLQHLGPRSDQPQVQTDYNFNGGKAVTTQRTVVPGAAPDAPAQLDQSFLQKASAIGGVKIDNKYNGQCGQGARGCIGALFGDDYFKQGLSTGGSSSAASLSKGNNYLQKSGLYQAPQAAGNVNDPNYLNSLPVGTVISAAGGNGNGHVQVKVADGQWASDALQGNKVLTARAGGTQPYTDFKVHLPTQEAESKIGQGAPITPAGGMYGYKAGGQLTGTPEDATKLIAHFEGYRETPYWDVNHHRGGYGSDTVTHADGTVEEVKPGMRISREDANRDLARRTQAFQQGIIRDIGQEAWSKLTPGARTALSSFAYNYGDGWAGKAPSVAAAAKSGDMEALGAAILSRRNDNGGVNNNRRRQEAELAAGRADFSTLVARDGNRGLDKEFHQTSSLDGRLRRDAMVKSFTDYAMKTGDTRVLDAIPPELITPGAAASIEQARKHAADTDWTRKSHEHTLAMQAQQEQDRAMVTAIDDKIVKGEPLDIDKDSRDEHGNRNHAAYTYLKAHMTDDSSIPVLSSDTRRANLEDAIEAASATGDFGGALSNPAWNGKTPNPSELRDWIDQQPDMRTTDKINLKKKLDHALAVGNVVNTPESKSTYHYNVEASLDDISKGVMFKALNSIDPATLKSDAYGFYANKVRGLMRQAIADNGGQIPSSKYKIYEDAAKATNDYVHQRIDTITKLEGKTGSKEQAKPTEKPKAESSATIKRSELPADAVPRMVGGSLRIKFVDQKGNITFKDVID